MGVCTNRKITTLAETGIMLQKSPGNAGAFFGLAGQRLPISVLLTQVLFTGSRQITITNRSTIARPSNGTRTGRRGDRKCLTPNIGTHRRISAHRDRYHRGVGS